MTDPEQTRAELLEAMHALHQAHALLIAKNVGAAVVQLDKSTAIIAEVRKQLIAPTAPPEK